MASDFISIPKQTQEDIKNKVGGLSKIARKRLNSWVSFALSEEANDYAEYVKANYLMGNPVRRITGELHGSVKAWTSKKSRNGIRRLYVRPGVGIQGSLNYLAGWAGTPLEFMRPSFAEFSTGERILRAVKRNVDKQLDKAAKEMEGEE